MKLEEISCYLGCFNMTLSMVFGAIASHKKSLTKEAREAMHRGVNMQQVAALGFILLSSNLFKYVQPDGTKQVPNLPFVTLFVATLAFPGIIYAQNLMGSGKLWASRFIPTGGVLHMLFWIELMFFYNQNN